MVAPAYSESSYVDHPLLASLDSTFAFEGPEKLLEIWFWPAPECIPSGITREGLKAVPLDTWKNILDLVNCKVLSMKSTPALDAYLLSESSLFVFPHKMILKTCGTTTTLACLDEIFQAVRDVCVIKPEAISSLVSTNVHRIFYSRRCFMFPEKQIHVHKDWKHEVALLNRHFLGGKLYVVGDYTSDDHWFLYLGGTSAPATPFRSGHDQTFEVLMTALDPVKAEAFFTSRKPSDINNAPDDHDCGHDMGMETMKRTKLDSLFDGTHCEPSEAVGSIPSPQLSDDLVLSDDETTGSFGFIHDAFSFTPCGFSSNSVSASSEEIYYTLHVTPESGWSYASFETNFPFASRKETDIVEVLKKVLSVFSPGRFSVTLFNDQSCKCNQGLDNPMARLALCDAAIAKLGYLKQEKIIYDLRGEYNLVYLHFEKQR